MLVSSDMEEGRAMTGEHEEPIRKWSLPRLGAIFPSRADSNMMCGTK